MGIKKILKSLTNAVRAERESASAFHRRLREEDDPCGFAAGTSEHTAHGLAQTEIGGGWGWGGQVRLSTANEPETIPLKLGKKRE